MKRIRQILIISAATLVIVAEAASWAAPRSARQQVRAGMRKHLDGDFEGASEAFAKAAAELPDDPRVAYDQACALAAQGETDEAAELFRKAATSREPELAAASHYNLGCLVAKEAKSLFGDEPEEATAEVRKQGIALIHEAVMHYRDCLQVDPEHKAARRNLEVLRLWNKHMLDVWAQRDREKRREEMDVLAFLQWIESEQRTLEAGAKALVALKPSPRQRQAAAQTERGQRMLAEEIGPLQEKIQTALTGANDAGSEALQAVTMVAQRAESAMVAAADDLAARSLARALVSQDEAIHALNDVYRYIAPYQHLLQRATQSQETLLKTTTTATEDANAESLLDRELLSRDQRFIGTWTETLAAKATVELPRAQAAGTTPEESQQQQEALRESFEKAIELAPKVVELANEAAQELADGQWQEALPNQEEALRLLKEIAPKNPPQDEQQQDDEEKQSDQDKQQNEQQNQQQDQSEQQQDQKNEQKQQQNENQTQENQKQRDLTRQQAESLLRKVRQREREHRAQKKQLQRLLQGAIPVDRDW
jgi:hypothetical protein